MTARSRTRWVPHSHAPSHLHPRPCLIFASFAILASACILTPNPSFAGDDLMGPGAFSSRWSPEAVPSTRRCHLDLNDRMKMDLGTWGSNIVHPHGPNYFCAERNKNETRRFN
jgi:hypothetical protein